MPDGFSDRNLGEIKTEIETVAPEPHSCLRWPSGFSLLLPALVSFCYLWIFAYVCGFFWSIKKQVFRGRDIYIYIHTLQLSN